MMRGSTAAGPYAQQLDQAPNRGIEKDAPFVTRIGSQIESLNVGLAELCKRINVVTDRVLGSLPQEAGEAQTPAPAHSTSARLEAAMREYGDGLQWLNGLVSRLEQL